MDRKTFLRILGLVGTAIGGLAMMFSDWVTEQETQVMIEEEVKKQLGEQETDDEDEES